MSDGISRLLCWAFGHKWVHLKGAIPEDRKTFRCECCGERGYHPSRVGENEVSARYVDTENDREESA